MVRPRGFPLCKKQKTMYRITKATIIQDGKPIKSYDVQIETEDLDEERKKILKRYKEESTEDLCVDLQYKEDA